MASNKDREHIRRLREEANALRKQEEAKRRRSRMLTQIGVVVGAILLVAGIVLVAVMAPVWFGKQNRPEASGTVSVPNSEGQQVEVPITINADGVTVGKPDAPSTVDYYLDFSCAHCKQYHDAFGHEYKTAVGDGETRITFHFVRIVNEYGLRAGSAMASAVAHDPSSFYTVMDGLFAIDPQLQVGWNEADYATALTQLGISDENVLAEVRDGHYHWWIGNSTQKMRDAGVRGTPSIAVNGQLQEQLPTDRTTLRALLAGETPQAPTGQPAEPGAEPGASGEPSAPGNE